jgi:uncharacterized protein YjbK
MNKNVELEFKTFITEQVYESLVDEFGLRENTFIQKNYYFDTENEDLKKDKIVLRIRVKNGHYKLTKKVHGESHGSIETHIFLTEDEAKEMLQNGFDASIIDLPFKVKKICELQTERCSAPYKNGKIFFDKSTYYGRTDFEIEYEADDWDEGKKIFDDFLKTHNIQARPSISKSVRALANYKLTL